MLHRLRAAFAPTAVPEQRSRTVLSRGHMYGDLNDAPTAALPVTLRPVRATDGAQWSAARIEDQKLLQPFEPTVQGDWEAAHSPQAWRHTFHNLQVLSADRLLVPMVIDLDGEFAGQLTIGNIQYGTVSLSLIHI